MKGAARNSGMAVDKIGDTLNEEFTKPRAGERWYATSGYRVLKARTR